MRFKNVLGISFLILLAAGAQPAIGAFWQWSKTATNNSTADPSINWSEGMSPSSVNDSARAMMARLAEQGADVSGSLVTSGTGTAYTVTTNQGYQTPTPLDGQLIGITVNATNGAAATLAVDAGTAYPIQSAAGVAAPAGTLISGSAYTLRYSVANNSWLLLNYFAIPTTIPLGALVPYTGTTVPNSNFVFPAGQCLSTTTYATYWAFLGSPAPGACGAGTFKIVDLSGRVPAGLDTMPGFSAAGRLTSAATGCGTAMTTVGAVCANGAQSGTLTQANLPSVNFTVNFGTITTSISGGSTRYGFTDGAASFTGGGAYPAGTAINTITASTTIGASTAASGGSGTASPSIPPTIGLTYILRVQ